MYNRKHRRDMEKKLGLYAQYQQMSHDKKGEVRRKRIATGKQIHLNNMQAVEEQREKNRSEKFAQILQDLIASGMDEKPAEALLVRNIELEEQREEKLAARRARQTSARLAKEKK